MWQIEVTASTLRSMWTHYFIFLCTLRMCLSQSDFREYDFWHTWHVTLRRGQFEKCLEYVSFEWNVILHFRHLYFEHVSIWDNSFCWEQKWQWHLVHSKSWTGWDVLVCCRKTVIHGCSLFSAHFWRYKLNALFCQNWG